MFNQETQEACLRFEQFLKQVPPLCEEGEKNPAQVQNVAHLKRAVEYYLQDPEFRADFSEDPDGTLGKYALHIEPLCVQAIIDPKVSSRLIKDLAGLPLPLKQYYAFLNEKLEWRNHAQAQGCVPTNPAFKKWRQRQVNRCWGAFSGGNFVFIHVPLVFELSLGCSVGCPFCALAAQPLKSVFRASEANLALWREVLTRSRKIIGPAAGEGICYCASEPLDNPDYEIFSAIFEEIMGRKPQITTAAALRNPERTRALLQKGREGKPIIHRFSLLELAAFRKVCQLFTPEELLYVELLPRYPEALMNVLAKAGRSREVEEAVDSGDKEDCGLTDKGALVNTISCSSGFIVNMAEKTLRLSTPCNADDQHPTGEITTSRFPFSDAEDFERVMLRVIAEQMPLSMDMQKPLRLQNFYRYEQIEGGFILYGASKMSITFKAAPPAPLYYRAVGKRLLAGTQNGREIAAAVSDETGVEPAVVFGFLRYLDKAGVLDY